MSNYSDKKQSAASCSAPPGDCPHVGGQLRVVNGRPDWFCVSHATLIDERKKRGMP